MRRWAGFQGQKYGNTRSDGFSSKLESAVHQILLLLERAGEITDIKQQVCVELICGIRWKVDFSYTCVASGEQIWAEAKGLETDRYRICKKLWEGGFGPGPLEIWKGNWRKPIMVETIIPKERPS